MDCESLRWLSRIQTFPSVLGEYNGKFMSGQMIWRGDSCVTPADHVRATTLAVHRNAFSHSKKCTCHGDIAGALDLRSATAVTVACPHASKEYV